MALFKQVQVDYDFSAVLAADYQPNAGSCVLHQYKELTDVHAKVGRLPDSYVPENTIINQVWWNRTQLDYQNLGQQLNMEIVSISSIMQPPGNCIPYHRDTFHKIKTQYPDRKDLKVRANIFLEDGALGHLMQFTVSEYHNTISNWQANTGYMFDSEILHLSANAGMKAKYTLQISGFALNQEQ